jgi:outer membrane usher protein
MGSLGAISLDVTHARARFEDDDESGQSYRFLYSKRFDETNTTFRLVGYRYSTEGYYTLNEWASRQNNESDFWTTGNRRSRLEGTWTQTFGDGMGNIYLTLSRQQYWKTNEVERLVQLGYSNSWRSISWNVSWNYTDSLTSAQNSTDTDISDSQGSEQIFMLSLSIPLSGWLHDSYVNYGYTQNNHGKGMHQVGLSGNALDAHNLSWNVQQSYDADNEDYNNSAGVGYDGTYGSVNASYDYTQDNQRLNYGMKGGILAHSDGITFSQELGKPSRWLKPRELPAWRWRMVRVRRRTGAAIRYRRSSMPTMKTEWRSTAITLRRPTSKSTTVSSALSRRAARWYGRSLSLTWAIASCSMCGRRVANRCRLAQWPRLIYPTAA